jgi:predicted nucleotidyltransferase
MNSISFSHQQSQALKEIKQRIMERFSLIDCLLYGSAARQQATEESDLDLLIVISEALTRFKRHEITDIVFEVNLKYGTNFSSLVVDKETWETGIISVLPLRDEILRNGVRV